MSEKEAHSRSSQARSLLAYVLDVAFSMNWEILWALVLGFALSAAAQAVVTKSGMTRFLPDGLTLGPGLRLRPWRGVFVSLPLGRGLARPIFREERQPRGDDQRFVCPFRVSSSPSTPTPRWREPA